MLGKLFKREPARLFLGNLSVTSRDWVRKFEELANTPSASLDRALLAELSDLILLPRVDAIDLPRDTDLALDVALLKYRNGSASDLWLGQASLPIYWPPSVRLAAKVYHLQTRKTRAEFQVMCRMPWSVYMGRVFSWKVLLRLEHPARRSDLEMLLRQAAEQLMAQVSRSIS